MPEMRIVRSSPVRDQQGLVYISNEVLIIHGHKILSYANHLHLGNQL